MHDLSLDGPRTRFSVDQGELNRVLERLVALDVRSLVSSPPTLEELFLRHYGDDDRVRAHGHRAWQVCDERVRRHRRADPARAAARPVHLTRLGTRTGRLPAATTALWADQLSTVADLVQETRMTAASPGIRMLGLASGASVGAYAMVRDFLLLAVLAALMSTFAVVRHTRQGEETGRAELIGAAVVGRNAGLRPPH